MTPRIRQLDLMKHPTGYMPPLMSASALLLFLAYMWVFPTPSQPDGDERTPARIYQLLMSLQIPVMLLFSALWLPREPRKTVLVLALQASAWLAAFLPVLLIEM